MFKENLIQQPNIEAEPEKNEAGELVAERDLLRDKVHGYIFNNPPQALNKMIKLDKMPEEEIAPNYGKMINRIFEETPALDEIKDTIGKDNMIRSLVQAKFPTEVEFDKINEMNQDKTEKSEKTTVGNYTLKSKKINVGDPVPRLAMIWRNLLGGYMNNTVETLDHELVHYEYYKNINLTAEMKSRIDKFAYCVAEKMQKKFLIYGHNFGMFTLRHIEPLYDKTDAALDKLNKKLAEFIDNSFNNYLGYLTFKKLKSEVTAQKADRVYNKDRYKTSSVVETLINSYGFNKPEDIDQIIVASQAIDRLRALGLSDSEIAKEMAKARYDKKTASLPAADKKIEKLAKAKGIEVEDVDTEVDLMRVKGEINMFKASLIAQEELDDFLAEKDKN